MRRCLPSLNRYWSCAEMPTLNEYGSIIVVCMSGGVAPDDAIMVRQSVCRTLPAEQPRPARSRSIFVPSENSTEVASGRESAPNGGADRRESARTPPQGRDPDRRAGVRYDADRNVVVSSRCRFVCDESLVKTQILRGATLP